MSIRIFAGSIGVSAPYISDVENGRRTPLKADKLRLVVKMLELSDEERYTLYDLASIGRDEAPTDIVEYINNNPVAKTAIRKASNNNVKESAWQKFIDIMNEEVTDNAS